MPDSSEVLLHIRSMKNADLEQVLTWRNHPTVRHYMFSQHEISLTEHRQWFERTMQNPKKNLLVFESNHQPQGVVSFSEVGEGGIADWGFYVAPDAPKGTGRQLGIVALRHAFTHFNFHKVCGQVMEYNQRSIRFHQSLGFRLEGSLRDHHFDGERYHQVNYFGLLRKEWHCDNRNLE